MKSKKDAFPDEQTLRRVRDKLSAPGVFVALGSASAFAANGKMPIDDTEIRLPDGRNIEAVRCGAHCHCLVRIALARSGVTSSRRSTFFNHHSNLIGLDPGSASVFLNPAQLGRCDKLRA